MSLETQVKASALQLTASISFFRIQRFVKGTLEYVSNGVTRDEPLILAFDPEAMAASRTIEFKWSSAEKTTSGLADLRYRIIGKSIPRTFG